VENKSQWLITTPPVIGKTLAEKMIFCSERLSHYQVSRFLSHWFSFHHPDFLRIKRSKKGDITLVVIVKYCTTGTGFRMALEQWR
jgi:hypothetical protein